MTEPQVQFKKRIVEDVYGEHNLKVGTIIPWFGKWVFAPIGGVTVSQSMLVLIANYILEKEKSESNLFQ